MVNQNSSISPDATMLGQSMPSILVVEDNTAVARAMSVLLKGAGYEPVVFHQGAPALEYAERKIPAAAIVDIHLPDFSGLVLSQKFRERFGSKVPIVVLSGDTSMATLNSLPHVGATYFFSKPVNGGHLIERLKEWVGENNR
jgi:DNA-binding response OmpR family regulator